MLVLRRSRADMRLLYVTPRSAETERLRALEAGVDEVLSEPISSTGLTTRLRLLLRRSHQVRRTRLPISDRVELELERRELLRDGAWVHLRPKEARLLELFARAPGRVLTRHHILERVWGPDHDGDPRTVDVHVRWLRSKIEPDPHAPVWLVTVRGVGYRLEQWPPEGHLPARSGTSVTLKGLSESPPDGTRSIGKRRPFGGASRTLRR